MKLVKDRIETPIPSDTRVDMDFNRRIGVGGGGSSPKENHCNLFFGYTDTPGIAVSVPVDTCLALCVVSVLSELMELPDFIDKDKLRVALEKALEEQRQQ